MITLSPQELQNIEDQFATAMFNAFEKVQDSLKASVASPHWVSHSDAVDKMGWPDILLKKGVKHGHLNPIKFQGKGGTQYDIAELGRYKDWLMEQRRANRLHPDYLTNTLPSPKIASHVLPDNSRKRRSTNGVSPRS